MKKEKNKLGMLIESVLKSDVEIRAIGLCTSDGFPIVSALTQSIEQVPDKFAAMSSTITALCDSSARLIHEAPLSIAIIETQEGNTLFLKTDYKKSPCVLVLVADQGMALGTARYKIINLSKQIQGMKEA